MNDVKDKILDCWWQFKDAQYAMSNTKFNSFSNYTYEKAYDEIIDHIREELVIKKVQI